MIPVLLACAAASDAPSGGTNADQDDQAAVLDVQVSGSEQDYTFAVTVASPDAGCGRYADWWEVTLPDGETLTYRRILAHSHTDEQPFTRSGGPIAVDADQEIVVRAHLNPDGYGQTAQRGSVDEGFDTVVLDPDFGLTLGSQSPQPDGCLF